MHLTLAISSTIYKVILLPLIAPPLFVQVGGGERSRLHMAILVGYDVLMAAVWFSVSPVLWVEFMNRELCGSSESMAF